MYDKRLRIRRKGPEIAEFDEYIFDGIREIRVFFLEPVVFSNIEIRAALFALELSEEVKNEGGYRVSC